jgi:hypothetical protein
LSYDIETGACNDQQPVDIECIDSEVEDAPDNDRISSFGRQTIGVFSSMVQSEDFGCVSTE